MAATKEPTIFQLNVALQETRPLIWRRIQVSSGMTLPKLHLALQIVMGWENAHLHEFLFDGKAYAEPDPEDHHSGRDVADERRVRLGSVVSAVGASFEYVYDFGDGWRHGILLEAILPVTPRKRYPVCLAGARSAPPEDVGGVRAYEDYLEVLSDPKHKDHRAMLDWRGWFNPDYFPITTVNRMLREVFPSPVPSSRELMGQRKKAAPPATAMGLEQLFASLIHSGRSPRKKRIPA